MAIDRINRYIEDKAPRFFPGEDGFTKENLEYMLEYRKKKDKKDDMLRVPEKKILEFANRRISEIYKEFGTSTIFRKYFGTADYSDRDPNTVYIQLGLVAPRNPDILIEVREYVFRKKEQVVEDVKIHTLYDEIEALEDMCLAFYGKVKKGSRRKTKAVVS